MWDILGLMPSNFHIHSMIISLKDNCGFAWQKKIESAEMDPALPLSGSAHIWTIHRGVSVKREKRQKHSGVFKQKRQRHRKPVQSDW